MFASIIQHWTFHPASFHRGRVASWARGVKWIMAHDGHTWFISNSRSIHPLSAPAGDQYVVDWTFVSTFFPPRQLLIDLGSQRRAIHVHVDSKFMYFSSFITSCDVSLKISGHERDWPTRSNFGLYQVQRRCAKRLGNEIASFGSRGSFWPFRETLHLPRPLIKTARFSQTPYPLVPPFTQQHIRFS